MASTTRRWIGAGLTVLAGLGVGCAEPDIPEHDVELTVSCDEEVFQASFHFEAVDFEARSSAGGLLSGDFSDTIAYGRWTGGDDFVRRAHLEGNSAETASYWFYLDERFEDPEPWPGYDRTPVCRFFRPDELGMALPCWFGHECSGRLLELD